jgi:hypothetical protein
MLAANTGQAKREQPRCCLPLGQFVLYQILTTFGCACCAAYPGSRYERADRC